MLEIQVCTKHKDYYLSNGGQGLLQGLVNLKIKGLFLFVLGLIS